MYAVSFILPMGGQVDAWGYEVFWDFFINFFDVTLEIESIWFLAINISNVIMITSPFILSRVNRRALATLLLIGGISNSRILWKSGGNGFVSFDLMDIFPAYYVWLLSFFMTGAALWQTPTLRR